MPSFEGNRICTVAEYRKHLDDRLMPGQMVVDEDYTIMLRLNKLAQPGHEAMSGPVRCASYPEAYRDHGIWVVRFAILDDDCQPTSSSGEKLYFNNNGMMAITEEFRLEDPCVAEGYVRAYDDGIGQDVMELIETRDLELTA